jgi:crotonobetaine/carnitine-CoA ligase
MAALQRALEKTPDRSLLDFAGDKYSYTDIDRESARLARGLRSLGVEPGHVVLTMLDNNVDAIAIWFAVNRLGAIWVPVNTAYKGDFLRHVIADSTAEVVVVEVDFVERLEAIDEILGGVKKIAVRGGADFGGPLAPKLLPLDGLRLDGPVFDDVPVRPGDVGSLIYTGGTTGPSKGCMISHNYMMHTGRQGIWLTDRMEDEPVYNPMPLFHLNCLSSIVGSILLGSTAVVGHRFSVTGFWPEIQRSGARIANVLGAMVPLIAHMDDTPELIACKGQLRAVLGVPFTPETERIWRERFEVQGTGNPGYGLTEGSSLTAVKVGQGPVGTSGRQYDAFDVRIFDEADRELPAGEVGEIVFRPLKSHVMFEGYWGRPEATLEMSRNMWFHSGDLGRFDDEGWMQFVDRKKDYLRRRGENISSLEMEGTILQHPAIVEVAVHAVPSALTEDDLKVTAVLVPGVDLNEEALCRWLIDRVPYFAVPRYIEFRDELPKSPLGRVLKRDLREEGCTGSTWDLEASEVTYERR